MGSEMCIRDRSLLVIVHIGQTFSHSKHRSKAGSNQHLPEVREWEVKERGDYQHLDIETINADVPHFIHYNSMDVHIAAR